MRSFTGKPKWQVPLHNVDIGMWAGTLSTAGGLLFTGKQTGEFIAMDEDNGNVLWRFQTGSAVNAQPITYTHKGRQYVSVLSGRGGSNAARFVTDKVPAGGMVWTFALMDE